MQNPLSDFERWWLDFGRFLPPLDRLTNQTGVVEEQFKAFAQAVVGACVPEIDAAYKDGMADAKLDGTGSTL